MYRSEENYHHLHKHPHHERHHADARRGGRRAGGPAKAGFHRRFFSREERIAGLEVYLNDLRAEAQAVEEKLARFKATD